MVSRNRDYFGPQSNTPPGGGSWGGFMNRRRCFNWLITLNIYKVFAMLLTLVVIFIMVSIMVHSSLTGYLQSGDTKVPQRKILNSGFGSTLKYSDLKIQIEELKRIKISVSNELLELESKRQRLNAEIVNYTQHIDVLRYTHENFVQQIDKLNLDIGNLKLMEQDMRVKNTPDIQAPKRLLASANNNIPGPPLGSAFYCTLHTCFDFSRCSLSSQFPVYFYDPKEQVFSTSPLDSFVSLSVTNALQSSLHLTFNANIACVYLVLIGDTIGGMQTASDLESKLKKLHSWNGDGRNHILVNIARNLNNRDVLKGINIGRAIVSQSNFFESQYRRDFDIILPPVIGGSHGDTWMHLPFIVPARREYLFSFQGELPKYEAFFAPVSKSQLNYIERDLLELEEFVLNTIGKLSTNNKGDNFLIDVKCESERTDGYHGEWSLCGPDSKRYDVLTNSTFSLILGPLNNTLISTTLIQTRIYEGLKLGAIPVILGNIKLAFEDMLPWKHAVLTLPKARVSELHYFLRSIPDADILELRRQGRLIWEQHLGTTKSVIDTLLATVRHRISIPPLPARREKSPSVFNASFQPLQEEVILEDSKQPEGDDDYLGSVEPSFPSPQFVHNFTYALTELHKPGTLFNLFPSTPYGAVMPSEAKFLGSGAGFRPINQGAGGTGKEFSESIGGNYQREQFTIVMLTYERETVLVNAVARLKGLPHLNKVVVVWNSPRPPAQDLKWPNIHVPVHVIKTKRNSLNNRFLPYDAIETDAILSIDDDAHLRHDEIIFGFRVWRENRERLVGFPGRFHAWDLKHSNWNYNSNYSCELSMVLTGAAFFHKYYAHLYSYMMPQAIRDKVDEYINCEDLAMNFLVSHITRKPPIKVTSRWTFRCPGCPVALSAEEEHFLERHKCMNFFVKVYGYMPLLYTQFRADSVLFKTRIPHDKQKCFKYI